RLRALEVTHEELSPLSALFPPRFAERAAGRIGVVASAPGLVVIPCVVYSQQAHRWRVSVELHSGVPHDSCPAYDRGAPRGGRRKSSRSIACRIHDLSVLPPRWILVLSNTYSVDLVPAALCGAKAL